MNIKSSKNVELLNLKKEICFLYKKILKAHFKFINNTDMRVFGDYFVKTEFNLQYNNPTPNIENMKIFKNQWEKYLSQITKKNMELDLDLKTKLDLEQNKTLNEIKDLVKDKI